MAVYTITPAETDFGGHEFEYESHTDLFRCVHCRQYEVSVTDSDIGAITACPEQPSRAG